MSHLVSKSWWVHAVVAFSIPGGAVIAQQAAAPPAHTLLVGDVAGIHAAGFVENLGQWPEHVLFAALCDGLMVWVEQDGVVLNGRRRDGPSVHHSSVKLCLDSRATDVEGQVPRDGALNYLVGADFARHVSGARRFESVRLSDARSGVDLVARLDGARLVLEWDFQGDVVPDFVALRIDGASELDVDSSTGAMRAHSDVGVLTLSAPRAPIEPADESPSRRPATLTLLGRRAEWRLDWQGADRATGLVHGIDAATFLGGATGFVNEAKALALAPDGDIVIAGFATSPDFPVTRGSYDTTFGGGGGTWKSDAFVARFSSELDELIFCTFVGGEGSDRFNDVAIDEQGRIIVVGESFEGFYPETTQALDSGAEWSIDCVLSVISADGASLLFSSVFGGSKVDLPSAVRCLPDSRVVVVGNTGSPEFPLTANAFDTSVETGNNPSDGFVSIIDIEKEVFEFSTFIGGTVTTQGSLGQDGVRSVFSRDDGTLVISGTTNSIDFPTTPGAYDTTYNLGSDVFVASIDPVLGKLLWSTFVGASSADTLLDMVEGPLGEIYLTGVTYNLASLPEIDVFPTTPGAYDTSYNFLDDVFACALDSTGSQLLYSTLFGLSGFDIIKSLAIDNAGVVTIAGHSDGFVPTTPGSAMPTTTSTGYFISRFDRTLSKLLYSTYLGGSGQEGSGDEQIDILLDDAGGVIACGSTSSPDFPVTPGAFDTEMEGNPGSVCVVAKLSMLPLGVERFGDDTPSCHGPMALGVAGWPQLGGRLDVTCTGATPRNAAGLALFGLTGLQQPLLAGGARLWVDPSTLLALVPVKADLVGAALLTLRMPDTPASVGLGGVVQFFWKESCGSTGWSASNALRITVQP